jgi:hypothetical protein
MLVIRDDYINENTMKLALYDNGIYNEETDEEGSVRVYERELWSLTYISYRLSDYKEKNIIIDFSKYQDPETDYIHEMMHIHVALQKQGKWLLFINLGDYIKRKMKTAGIISRILSFENEEEALLFIKNTPI